MVRAVLGEGNTPLVESVRIGPSLGVSRLLFKLESCNPSGSYKDRFIAAQVTRLLSTGVIACVATSSGNTGSSLAAYCARYRVACAVIVNEHAPAGKLVQMQGHGAHVLRVKGFVTSPDVTRDVLLRLSDLSNVRGIHLVVSAYRYCPEGMAGVESIAQEICRQATSTIDHVFVPVGGGGLYTALSRGFTKSNSKPRLHAVQPQGCSTVVGAFERGADKIRSVESTTSISGLAVPYDIDASLALEHLRQSGGTGVAVSDEEVYEAQRLLLVEEGIYAEPAGAAALAGLRRAVPKGLVRRNETVVCLVTGHGFKDPDSISKIAGRYAPTLIEVSQIEESISAIIPLCA